MKEVFTILKSLASSEDGPVRAAMASNLKVVYDKNSS